MSGPLLQSFFVAGFEASTMRRADGPRNDLVAATRHDELAERDYERLRAVGITTVREGAAWHRIEERAGSFEPSSALGRIRAGERLGMQAIWDLCHFGWPDDVDPFAADFADRLAAFAGRFAALLRDETTAVPWYAPLNEPSFVAWAAGDVAYLNPFQRGRGNELKRQLIRAQIAAAAAVREVDPRARICHIDPVIHIEPHPRDPESAVHTVRHNDAQFEAWDMLAGRREDELGGSEAELDVIGVNFYGRNQWVDRGPTLSIGEPGYRALRDLLGDVHRRYRRPIIVAETGTEGDGRAPWLRYVCDEVAAARGEGISVEGICLYPALDHPGWDDDRHVPVGMWGYADEHGDRPPYQPLIDELRRQSGRFAHLGSHEPEPGAATSRVAHAAALASPPVDHHPTRHLQAASGAGVHAPGAGALGSRQRRLAICLVTDSREPSGMGRLMMTLARGLAERHRVIVAAPDAIDARWLLAEAAAAGLEAWALTDGSPRAQAAALRARLAADHVDLVNVHAGIGWEGHAAAAAARAAAVPAVVRTEHLPFLLTKAHEQADYLSALAQLDRIIAVSEGVADSHVAAGVPAHLIRAVRNGIDEPAAGSERRAVRRVLGIADDAPLAVSVGRLTDQKGYDVLLAAARDVVRERPDAQFVLVGSGPLAATLPASIRDLGLERNARLLPRWTHVPELLAAADLLALASRFEGLPLVALEAMAVCRPVVGTRVCGLDEAVEDGVTGRLVSAEDASAMAAAILATLADPVAAAAHGAAGRRRFETAFTARRMVADTEAVYAELVHDPSPTRHTDTPPTEAPMTPALTIAR